MLSLFKLLLGVARPHPQKNETTDPAETHLLFQFFRQNQHLSESEMELAERLIHEEMDTMRQELENAGDSAEGYEIMQTALQRIERKLQENTGQP